MTNTERIQANNAELRECIETAENLPDAGGAVADSVIQPLEVTENGAYTAPDGVDGYSPVVVDVPIPEGYIVPIGTLEVTENGAHDVTQYASVSVNVAGSGGSSDLPDGYTRADYIQFNGSRWIDTGIIGNQDTQVIASFTWESSTQRHLYGAASSDNKASMTAYMNGSWRFGDKTASKSIATKNPMLPYSMLVNKTTIACTNSATSISGVTDFETVGTLLLGGCRDADGTLPGVGFLGKVFSFSLWQGDELVQKLVPVVSSDGQYQFYDLVSKTLFSSITSTPLDGGNL